MTRIHFRTYLSLLVLSVLVQRPVSGRTVDSTRQVGANGTCVVSATVSLVQESRVFPRDNRMLRRLAYVETRDGESVETYREGYFGGIWQVNREIFYETLNTTIHPQLLSIYSDLVAVFGIDWLTVQWEDLAAPLFSALAANLYFTVVNESIPQAGNISGQASYWKTFYNSRASDTEQFFVDSVNEFEFQGKSYFLDYNYYDCRAARTCSYWTLTNCPDYRVSSFQG